MGPAAARGYDCVLPGTLPPPDLWVRWISEVVPLAILKCVFSEVEVVSVMDIGANLRRL